MKIIYAALKGEFEAAMREKYRPLAVAGSAAMTEVATTIKTDARQIADYRSANPTRRWNRHLITDRRFG